MSTVNKYSKNNPCQGCVHISKSTDDQPCRSCHMIKLPSNFTSDPLLQVSDVQEIVENGFKTKVMIINQAASYCDIVREVTKFLDEKAKCCYSKKVTVAISVKFPVPKEYSNKMLQGGQEIES